MPSDSGYYDENRVNAIEEQIEKKKHMKEAYAKAWKEFIYNKPYKPGYGYKNNSA